MYRYNCSIDNLAKKKTKQARDMCKSTENRWIYQRERPRLKIKAFYVRLSISEAQQPLPESITLLYLPRINESPLEINDSKIRSDLAAFLTLNRVRSAEINSSSTTHRDVVFASRERVRAREGVRFEVYLREEKILKGSFRRDTSKEDEWKLDCKCALEGELVGFAISEAAVCLICDEDVEISDKVEMVMRRNRRKKTCKFLEEIPEENEVDNELESEGCSCCDDMEISSDGEENYWEEKMKMEGVSWAVDVGIWVMCLGVGYLVSKASSKSLRRRRIL